MFSQGWLKLRGKHQKIPGFAGNANQSDREMRWGEAWAGMFPGSLDFFRTFAGRKCTSEQSVESIRSPLMEVPPSLQGSFSHAVPQLSSCSGNQHCDVPSRWQCGAKGHVGQVERRQTERKEEELERNWEGWWWSCLLQRYKEGNYQHSGRTPRI